MKQLLLLSLVLINTSCLYQQLSKSGKEKTIKVKVRENIAKSSTFIINAPGSTSLASDVQLKDNTISATLFPLINSGIKNDYLADTAKNPGNRDTVRIFVDFSVPDTGTASFTASNVKNITIHSGNKIAFDHKEKIDNLKVTRYVAVAALTAALIVWGINFDISP